MNWDAVDGTQRKIRGAIHKGHIDLKARGFGEIGQIRIPQVVEYVPGGLFRKQSCRMGSY